MGRLLGLALMGVPGVGPGARGGPANTAAPTIAATATIGTEITATPGTWTGEPVLTYQWQRQVAGTWTAISGATASAYTPVDADFGYALRVAEIPNGNAPKAAYSEATALTVEVPISSLGAEILANPGFEGTYVGGVAPNWSPYASPPTVAEETSIVHGGSKSQKIVSDGADRGVANVLSLSAGQLIEASAWFYVESGSAYLKMFISSTGQGQQRTTLVTGASWRRARMLYRTTTALYRYLLANLFGTFYVDDASAKVQTPNAQLAAPAPDMQIEAYYTLPETPDIDTQVQVLLRVSSISSGNYWLLLLNYSGSQWDLTLQSVTEHTRAAAAITASDIGVSNGLRVTADGNDWTLESTANGETWTPRGTTSSDLYNTATGVNVVTTQDVTPGELRYVPVP